MLLTKRLRHRCFLMYFAKFLRKAFLRKTSGQLILLVNFVKQINYRLFPMKLSAIGFVIISGGE